jgi:hypothetical protein
MVLLPRPSQGRKPMRLIVCLTTTAALALSAVSTQAPAKTPGFQLNHTSWTFVDPDKKVKVRESIDAQGNYIENAVSGKHIDHGTAVMKEGKACFTSAMTNEGESCWTTSPVKIGHSMVTTSDKGEKLKVTRIAYVRLSMPK